MSRDELVAGLYKLMNRQDWRMVAALTEEAGEVQGAFNKWQDGNIRKPKDITDVIEETTQLLACCLLLGHHWGINAENMLHRMDLFLADKTDEVRHGS